MNLRSLRALAREMHVPLSLVEAGLECGLFPPEASLEADRRLLLRAHRLMRDLGVNPAGAALLLRMKRDMEMMEAEMARLRRRQVAFNFDEWFEGVWRELDE
jgi:hypothetical protein